MLVNLRCFSPSNNFRTSRWTPYNHSSDGFLLDFAAWFSEKMKSTASRLGLSNPRPGARQDVAALAAFLASFGGGAGWEVWVCHGVSQKNGLPKSDEIDGFCWFPRPLNQINRIDSTWAYVEAQGSFCRSAHVLDEYCFVLDEYCFEKDYPPNLPKFQPKL